MQVHSSRRVDKFSRRAVEVCCRYRCSFIEVELKYSLGAGEFFLRCRGSVMEVQVKSSRGAGLLEVQSSSRHAKCHNRREQRSCKIFRGWVNLLIKHMVFCYTFNLLSIF